MFEILTVCTGNICRSPLAELLLRTRLAGLDGAVSSAGTYGLDAAEMPSEAKQIAAALGVPLQIIDEHRSRRLTGAHLTRPDLVLTMAREHRRSIVELDPSRLRSTFTVREFARLAQDTPDDEIRSAVAGLTDSSARLRAAVQCVASHRGMSAPPATPEDDDVIDPYRRSMQTYERSTQQLVPAIDEVVRVVRTAMG